MGGLCRSNATGSNSLQKKESTGLLAQGPYLLLYGLSHFGCGFCREWVFIGQICILQSYDSGTGGIGIFVSPSRENSSSVFLNWNRVQILPCAFQIEPMRRIQLPEPPSPTARRGTPDIFESGVHTFVRRAVVIGNGSAASENQSVGLVRALGLADKHVLYVRMHDLLFSFCFSATISSQS